MTEYIVVGSAAVIKNRNPITPRGGRVTLSVPKGATVFVNGRPLVANDGRVSVSSALLREVNTVRIKDGTGSRIGESFKWDGTTLIPCGYMREEFLLELAAAVSDITHRLMCMEEKVAYLTERVETSLFV